MRTSETFVAATCAISCVRAGCGFLHVSGFDPATACGHDRPSTGEAFNKCSRLNRRGSCSVAALARRSSSAVRAADEDILLTFKPSEVQVTCKPGEVALEVAQRCAGMVEDNRNPFCRDGGCYNCEVEVVEADELGLADNLVRSCLFKVPDGAKTLTLIQMNSEEAFEDMI